MLRGRGPGVWLTFGSEETDCATFIMSDLRIGGRFLTWFSSWIFLRVSGFVVVVLVKYSLRDSRVWWVFDWFRDWLETFELFRRALAFEERRLGEAFCCICV